MPDEPLSPMPTKMAEAMMRVIRVMPDTGFEPTIAIALAATVVNRNAMSVTTSHATNACQNVLMTPIQKNNSTAIKAMETKNTICFIEISLCQRTVEELFRHSSLNGHRWSCLHSAFNGRRLCHRP